MLTHPSQASQGQSQAVGAGLQQQKLQALQSPARSPSAQNWQLPQFMHAQT